MGEGNNGNEMCDNVNVLGELTQEVIKRFPKQKNLLSKLFTMGEACVVPFCIFQIMADEQCSGKISPVGDQCESAVEDQGKSD